MKTTKPSRGAAKPARTARRVRDRSELRLLIALATLLMTIPSPSAAQQKITQFRESGDSSENNPKGMRIRWAHPGSVFREELATRSGLEVTYGDTLTVRNQWVMHLQLDLEEGVTGQVAVAEAPFSSEKDANAYIPPPGARGGRLRVLQNGWGGALVQLLTGALFLYDWDESSFCIAAVTAVACVPGTSYGLTVDEQGLARLAVTEGMVEIRWWGSNNGALVSDGAGRLDPDKLRAAKVAINVDAVPSESDSLVIKFAQEGEVWEWTNTMEPQLFNPDEEAAILLQLAVKYQGKDIWSDPIYKKWWFWTPPVAVAACLIFDIWICGGDVSGNVILNPSR